MSRLSSPSYRLNARFRFRDPMLFRARARLTDSRVELSGWHWHRRYRRDIDLNRIVHVDVKGDRGLILWLIDGEVVRLSVDEPRVWQSRISELTPLAKGG